MPRGVWGKQTRPGVRERAPGTRVSGYPGLGTGYPGSTSYWVPGIDEVLGTWDRRGNGYLERGAGYPGSTRYWVAGRRLRWSAAVPQIGRN